MKSRTALLGSTVLALSLLTGSLPASAASRPAASGPAASAGDELDRAAQRFVDAGLLGAQLRVDDESGTRTATAGRRTLHGARAVPDDGRFRAGSVTKTVTATVVLQLVDEGRIGLDDPVAGVLPRFDLDPRITVRMLLQQTSGLFSYSGDLDADGDLVPGIAGTLDQMMAGRFRSYEPDELVRYALDRPARFEPGTAWSYSNTNYTLARLVIEAVTGRPFADEVQSRILRPLGMRDTIVPGDRTGIPGPHARAYYRFPDGTVEDVTRMNLSGLAGAGDLISTTADLDRFLSALLSGELLSPALLEEMRTPFPGSGGASHGEYGLGLFVLDLGPGCGVVVQHGGSVPGYATLMYSTPDGGTTLTGSVTYVSDGTESRAGAYFAALNATVRETFCD